MFQTEMRLSGFTLYTSLPSEKKVLNVNGFYLKAHTVD